MRTRHLLLAILLAGTSAIAFGAHPPDARALMEKATALRKLAGSEAVSTLTIYNAKGQARVRKTAIVSKLYDGGKTEKRLVRFLAPADVKGTGLLTFDYEAGNDDVWLYMPALRKTRRIVGSEQSKSFMGSEFTYADMNYPTLDDFTYALLGEESLEGVAVYKLAMRAKDDAVADSLGYRKRLVWVGKDDFVVRRVEYFDFDDQLFKVMTASDVRAIDAAKDLHRAFKLEMRNVQNDRRSTLEVEKLELNPGVGDDYFTPRYLERS